MKIDTFFLNKDECFFLTCEGIAITDVTWGHVLEIIWCNNNTKTCIGSIYSSCFTDSLIELLSAAVNNKLFFDEQSYIDIGLIWDEFSDPEQSKNVLLQYATSQTRKAEFSDETNINYSAFNNYPNNKAFIYNNHLGEIIFLVAPRFSWPDDPNDDEQWDTSQPVLMQYLDFLKSYKPFLKKIIPQEIAQQWLLQAKKLEELFRKNEIDNCLHCQQIDDDSDISSEKYPNGIYHERTVKK